MVAWKWCSLGVALLAVACDAEQSEAVAGGSTEDFNGNDGPGLCTRWSGAVRSPVAMDEVSSMGFSPHQVLDLIEGSYTVPIRWVHPCSDYECGGTACAEGDAAPEWTRQFVATPFTDTDTTLRVRIEATGEPAMVHSDTEGAVECDDIMTIPAVMSVSSDDGALDEEVSIQLLINRSNEVVALFTRGVEDLHGAFSTGLEPGATIELSLTTYRDGDDVRLSVNLVVGGDGGYSTDPVLRGALLGTGCSDTVSRDEVLDP